MCTVVNISNGCSWYPTRPSRDAGLRGCGGLSGSYLLRSPVAKSLYEELCIEDVLPMRARQRSASGSRDSGRSGHKCVRRIDLRGALDSDRLQNRPERLAKLAEGVLGFPDVHDTEAVRAL